MKQFAIIGCGEVAKIHAVNIARIANLAAVCDIAPGKADQLAIAFNARPYYSIEELLACEKELDVVVVCTPNGLHAEHIIKTLQAGKDVLCESPLCLTKAAAWQIIETEKYCGRKLFVAKPTLFSPVLKELKNLLDKNCFGELYSFHLSGLLHRPAEYYSDWHGKIFPGGGALYSEFNGCIQLLIWLFGSVSEVNGFIRNAAPKTGLEYEDTGAVVLQMENETIGTFHWSVNATIGNDELSLVIVTEKGAIKTGGEFLQDVKYSQSEIQEEGLTDISSPRFKKQDQYVWLYDQLKLVFENNTTGFPSAHDGLKVVETIEKIYKATNRS